MPTLSIREIYDAARGAGFDEHEAVTWTAIAMAESRGRTGALNDRGEHSVGLWQINVAADVRSNPWGDLNDPRINAKAAFEISKQGLDMRPWTTTHDRNKGTPADYRTYLSDIEAEIGVKGDPRGVRGYYDSLPTPLSYATSYDIDEGKPLSEGTVLPETSPGEAAQTAAITINRAKDTDRDGLTDAFEKLVGTDAKESDSDADGLSDSYEAITSHTDPLSGDTDADGISDPTELAGGTDPGTLPGIAGVVGTGVFAENVRHGVKDTDRDGLSDKTEKLVGTNARKADSDRDGLSDSMEVSLGTDPTLTDTDHDGLSDGLEVRYDSDPLSEFINAAGQTVKTAAWTPQRAYDQRVTQQRPVTTTPEPVDQAPAAGPTTDSKLSTFLEVAQAQKGDPYVYGADPKAADLDPDSFDCSALTQWAAHQVGVELPRIAEAQYMQAKGDNQLISVDEAIKTPGALLFYFSKEPTGPLPAGQAHVAISLGDGRTIEARGTAWGVGTWSAKDRSFNYAAVIPQISDAEGLKEYRSFQTGTLPPTDPAPSQVVPAGATGVTGGTGGTGATGTASPYDIDSGQQLNGAAPLPGAKTRDRDRDQDGLTDAFEKLAGTDLKKADTDGDGLSDGYEALSAHTDPLSGDTDDDGISDPTELAGGTDPGTLPGMAGVVGVGAFAENIRDGVKDTDRDGLSNHAEKLLGTDAKKADSDLDGLTDAMEMSLGTNPRLADTDRDGLSDRLEVDYEINPLSADLDLAQDLPGRPADSVGIATPLGTNPETTADPATGSAGLDPPSRTGAGEGDLDPVAFGGKTVDRRSAAMLAESERLANLEDPTIGRYRLTQGSWSGADTSAGTHEGAGAFDQYTAGYTEEQKQIIGMAHRTVGFASWRRERIPGKWEEHWHAIAMGTQNLPEVSQSQVRSYRDGRDGLIGNGPDPDPRPEQIRTWEQYQDATAATEQTTAPEEPFAIDPGGGLDQDADSDGDGLTDSFEKLLGTDPKKADTDDDGLSDAYEAIRSHTDPLSGDTDNDGITDPTEIASGTDPGQLPDTDHDGLSDLAEKILGTDAAQPDSDLDGLSDALETSLGTDPTLTDSDGDGLSDGLEVQYELNPLAPQSGLFQGLPGQLGGGGGTADDPAPDLPGTGVGDDDPIDLA